MTFGEYIKRRRLDRGWSLRKFTEMAGLDPSNYSKVERGAAAAPTGERLVELGRALGIKQRSADWAEFEDLAAASRAVVPAGLDSIRVVSGLPAFFRIMRKREKVTRKDLDELVRKIKEAG